MARHWSAKPRFVSSNLTYRSNSLPRQIRYLWNSRLKLPAFYFPRRKITEVRPRLTSMMTIEDVGVRGYVRMESYLWQVG